MSKRAFVSSKPDIQPVRPVKVVIKEPHPLPEREPRNLLLMIGIPVLIIGVLGTFAMLYFSGVRNLSSGFFPIMSIGGIVMMAFSGRFGKARKISWGQMELQRRTYLRDLDIERAEIQRAVIAQRKSQEEAHSNPRDLGALIGDPKKMWTRRRGQPDFLDVRLGVGVQHAPDSVVNVQWPNIPVDEELDVVEGVALRDMILEQRKIRDIAKVQNLRSQPGFSFVGEDLDRVRNLVRSMLFMLAVWHDPREVKLLMVTRNPELWSSLVWLPHARHDELFDACGFRRLIFASPGELEEALAADLHMRGKRGAWKPDSGPTPTTTGSPLEADDAGGQAAGLGPHLVIVDDNTGSPEAWESVVGKFGKEGITLLRVASRTGVGVGFDKGQVFEMTERRQPATPGVPATIGGEDDDARPAPLLRTGGAHFANADQLSPERAYRYARAMARHSAATKTEFADSASGTAELLRSLGIDDPRVLDVDRLWANRRSRADERWGVVPVGAKENGELQEVIFRAKDFGGFGFHSVVIGTSGSGKSEFFLSLVYGIALTHSPETFNVIFVDMKFESAAQDIMRLPHVSAALSNLGKDDRHLNERMRIAIDGEMARRYRLFHSVGARDATEYEEIRLAGRDLEPVPILLIVIDEYLELFHLYPKWIDLIIHIGQEGRGANVYFMLGGQRLDLSSLQKAKSNIAFRIALRAESGDDSREVIGSDAAYNLPSKEAGHALVKVGPRELQRFRCFYLSGPFVLPKVKQAAAKTVDMLLTEPRVFNHEYQPLAPGDVAALDAVAHAEEEPDQYLYHADGFKKKKILDVMCDALVETGRKAPHVQWLPPQEVSSSVDELVQRYRGKPWDVDYGNNAGLVLPIAMEDVPEDAAQVVYSVDVLRSNVMVASAKGRGKTTTLMTLMATASLMYTPKRITFFCIGGATMSALTDLPHVADVVLASDLAGVERTAATMEALVNFRQDSFRRRRINIDDFREQRFGPGSDGIGGTDPADVYGDVFVVIDDFADLYAADSALADRLINISSIGPEYGVHVMSSASGWIHGQRQALLQNSDVRIQLRLQEPNENQMGSATLQGREAARNTYDRPGFGLNPALHEILIGVPELTAPDGSRINTRDLCTRVAEVSGVSKHATLKRLPEAVALHEIIKYDNQVRPVAEAAPSIAFMIGERHELLPVPQMLESHPGMMILGRKASGKSTTLMAIGEAITARFTPEQAQITIIDPNGGPLQNLSVDPWLRKYAYGDQDSIDETLTELAEQVLRPRLPPPGLTQQELRELKPWEGPRHFVLIDDVHDLRGQQMGTGKGFVGGVKPPVGSALWKLMEQARRIGLHVFTTRNSSNFGVLEMDPWMKFSRAAKVPMLYMDNSPNERITKTVRAQELPAGRGLLLVGDTDVEGVLVGVPTPMLSGFRQQGQ